MRMRAEASDERRNEFNDSETVEFRDLSAKSKPSERTSPTSKSGANVEASWRTPRTIQRQQRRRQFGVGRPPVEARWRRLVFGGSADRLTHDTVRLDVEWRSGCDEAD